MKEQKGIMEDTEQRNLANGGASTITEVAPEGNGAKAETPAAAPQYLTMEQARKLFQEEAERAVTGIQRVKDKQISAAERRAAELEGTLKTIMAEQGVEETTVNAARYKVAGQVNSQFDAEERQRAELATIDEGFRATIAESLQDLDVDPKDKRIDWGEGPPSNVRLKKVLSSIVKIHKDNAKKVKEDIEAEVRKASGVDEVVPPGTGKGDSLAALSPKERVGERDRRLREGKK